MLGASRAALLWLVAVYVFAAGQVSVSYAEEISILAGTTHLAGIVHNLAGRKIEVHSVIPGGACPGHYDVSPGDVRAAAEASVVLLQPWQTELYNIKRLLSAAEVPQDRLKVIAVPGSWMLPRQQIEATKAVADILSLLAPDLKETIAQQRARRIERINSLAAKLKNKLKRVMITPIPVLSNEMQKDFLNWTGFEVVASYGRLEELTPSEISYLVSVSKKAGVRFVVDNLQSGEKTGVSIASEVGAEHVVLSNFPGASGRGESWEETFNDNVSRLVSTLTDGGV